MTLRVGIVTKHLHESSGVGTYSRALIKALADRPELELTVFTPRSAPGLDLPGSSVEFSNVSGRYEEAQWAAFEVPRAARRRGLDLLHYLFPAGAVMPNVPYVTTAHDAITFAAPGYREGRAVESLSTLVIRRAAMVITVSHSAAQEVIKWYGPSPERVVPILLGGAEHRLTPRAEAEDKGRWWLFMGGIERRKNLPAVFEAWSQLGPDRAPLECVGTLAPSPRHFDSEMIRRAAPDGACLRGMVDEAELDRLFDGAIALVHATRAEGFGLPMLEAMARGVPVIASRLSATPEVAGGAALLVDPDSASIAAAMRRLMTEPGLSAKLRRKGLERAALLSWSQTAAATADVYASVAAGEHRERPVGGGNGW